MFKQLIDSLLDEPSSDSTTESDMRKISIQLLLEVARSDDSIDAVERDTIIRTIIDKTSYSPDEIDQLMLESEEAVDQSISFHQHVRLVNERFDRLQKIQLIEQMWEVAYADGKLNAYEEAFIRQVADLVYIRHRDFIQAKHRVQP